MTLTEKKKNRLKSFAYIGGFAASIVVAVVALCFLFTNISNNAKLSEIKSQLIQERDAYLNGENDEDCYTVYVRDDYVLDNGEIFIFKK